MKINNLVPGDLIIHENCKTKDWYITITEIQASRCYGQYDDGNGRWFGQEELNMYELVESTPKSELTDIEKVLLSYLIDEKITDIERMKHREEIKLNVKIFARQIQELENIKEKL